MWFMISPRACTYSHNVPPYKESHASLATIYNIISLLLEQGAAQGASEQANAFYWLCL